MSRVDLAEKCAVEIAKRLAATIEPRSGWELGDLSVNRPETGQYAAIPIFTRGERIDFSVWLDRTRDFGEVDTPIICAAFGVAGRRDGDALEQIAKGQELAIQHYEYDQADRFEGFGGVPVVDHPVNAARFLTLYRAAGDYAVETAVDDFRAFFVEYEHLVSDIERLPKRRRRAVDVESGETRALCGLAGELAVLSAPAMSRAEWVGYLGKSYDIKLGHSCIEVKTRGEALTATLSYRQLRASEDDRYFFAIVDLNAKARLALLTEPAPKGTKLHPTVERHSVGIKKYLRGHGITPRPTHRVMLSEALRHAAPTFSLHRARPPQGFWEAVSNVGKYGRVTDLAIACGPEWFEVAELPPASLPNRPHEPRSRRPASRSSKRPSS